MNAKQKAVEKIVAMTKNVKASECFAFGIWEGNVNKIKSAKETFVNHIMMPEIQTEQKKAIGTLGQKTKTQKSTRGNRLNPEKTGDDQFRTTKRAEDSFSNKIPSNVNNESNINKE